MSKLSFQNVEGVKGSEAPTKKNSNFKCNDFDEDNQPNCNSSFKLVFIEQENEEEGNFRCDYNIHTSTNIEKINLTQTSSSDDSDEEINYKPSEEDDYDHVGLEALKELSSDDEHFEKEIIEFFVENFPDEIKSLEDEIIAKNKNQINFWIHKMKTPLGMFGLKKIKEKLEKIEIFCNRCEDDNALTEFKSLKNNLNVIYNEFKNILGKYK